MNTLILSEADAAPFADYRRIMDSSLIPARAILQMTLNALVPGSDRAQAAPLLVETFNLITQIGTFWCCLDGRIAGIGDQCHDISKLLLACYYAFGHEELLDHAISLGRESLLLHPLGHPHRASSCNNLVRSLGQCCQDNDDDQILIEMVALGREALSLCPSGHSDREESCDSLSNVLEFHHGRSDDCQMIIEAIDLRRELLFLCPPGHPDRARVCADLARVLHTCIKRTGDNERLNELIDCNRELLSLCKMESSKQRSSCVLRLIHSLDWCYKHTGADELIIEAVEVCREALSLCSTEDPERAELCMCIAHLLKLRCNRLGKMGLLAEAIQFERQSLSLRPPGHPDHVDSCTALSLSLVDEYRCTSNDQSLTEAIYLQREALHLCPPGHEHHARSCLNMAQSLKMRYGSTGDDHLLVQAIGFERKALSLYSHSLGSEHHVTSLLNLALSLKMRYRGTSDIDILVEAIDLERSALSLCPSSDFSRIKCCINLASTLRTYYVSTSNFETLNEAVGLQREGIALLHPEVTGSALAYTNLANSLKLCYERTGDGNILNEIHGLCQEGLRLEVQINRTWRLASLLVWLHSKSDTAFFDIDVAIQSLTRSLEYHPDIASEAISVHMVNLNRIWDMAQKLSMTHHATMSTAYQRLIEYLPFLVNPVLDTQSQLGAVRLCSRFGSDACVNAILAENVQLGVKDLEVAQGLVWAQRLHYKDPQLSELPEELAAQLNSLMKTIAVPGTVAEPLSSDHAKLTPRDVQHNQVTEVYALLKKVRAMPGLEGFMLGEPYSALHSTASKHPVVLLVGSRGYFYALLLKPGDQTCSMTSLPVIENDLDFSCSLNHTPQSQRGAESHDEALMEANGERALKKASRFNEATALTRRILRYLWINIVKPVLDHAGIQPSDCDSRPRLHWCATGAFTSLPLHAAGIYDGPIHSRVCCADYVVSSYTPTLTTLLRAQRSTVPLKRKLLHVSLVAEKQALESHLQRIPQVEVEVHLIAGLASLQVKKCLQLTGATTVSGACDVMHDANIVHLACHGIQNGDDALQSGFCLGDGRLTISKLMELKLDNAFLAFLSACETAKGDKNQPDQVMHLAAAMMFAGFKTVIATMWAISDEDGPRVAKWFYEELFSKEMIDGDAVAYSLDSAVRKLRDSGVSLDRWAPFIQMGV